MKLAPSKNPEKESKQFSMLGLICGALSLLLWPVAFAGLGFSARGIILSHRINNKKQLNMSVAGLALSIVAMAYYLI